MNIQFVKEQENVQGEVEEVGRIILDEIKDHTSSVHYHHLYIRQNETYRKLMELSFEELTVHFDSINYSHSVEWCEYDLYLTIALPKIKATKNIFG